VSSHYLHTNVFILWVSALMRSTRAVTSVIPNFLQMKTTIADIPATGVLWWVIGAVAVAATLAVAITAFAAGNVTITSDIHNTSHAVITSAAIGAVVHDRVAVATSSVAMPTGTVDFNLYANTTCTGTPTVQSGVALAAGIAESSTTAVPSTGLSYKVHYNGDASNVAADGACEPLTATATSVGVATALSTTSVQVGASVHDSATLSNKTASAGGTVTYGAYTDAACTAGLMNAGTKTVTNGIVPDSNALQFNSVGTFHWQAVYSGDDNNSSATSTCADKVLTVAVLPTATGVMSGTVYNDLNKNGTRDSGESGLGGWTINLFKGSGWWSMGTEPMQSVVSASDGTYAFAAVPDGTYSVEQVINKGWNQLTDDYDNVVISGGASKPGLDFGDAKKRNKKFSFRQFKVHFKHHFRGEHGRGHDNNDD